MKNINMKTVAVLAGFAATLASAETYNFYFNNTEQGANSTASPKLMVGSGDASKKPLLTEKTAADATTVLPPAVAMPAGNSNMTETTAPQAIGDPFNPWRFGIGFSMVRQKIDNYGLGDDLPLMKGFSAGISYSFSKWLGIASYFGVMKCQDFSEYQRDLQVNVQDKFFIGTELEFSPLRFVSAGGNDIFALSLLAGADSASAASGDVVSPHVGARMNIGIYKNILLTCAARRQITSDKPSIHVEGGIGIQL